MNTPAIPSREQANMTSEKIKNSFLGFNNTSRISIDPYSNPEKKPKPL